MNFAAEASVPVRAISRSMCVAACRKGHEAGSGHHPDSCDQHDDSHDGSFHDGLRVRCLTTLHLCDDQGPEKVQTWLENPRSSRLWIRHQAVVWEGSFSHHALMRPTRRQMRRRGVPCFPLPTEADLVDTNEVPRRRMDPRSSTTDIVSTSLDI
jgi:hypothetical protein